MPGRCWHLLQNVRTDFYQKSLYLKVEAPGPVDALNKTEAMFDTAFVKCLSGILYTIIP